jgi:hypothetical protein
MNVPSPSDRIRLVGGGAGPPPGAQTPTIGQVRISSVGGKRPQLRAGDGAADGGGRGTGRGRGACCAGARQGR